MRKLVLILSILILLAPGITSAVSTSSNFLMLEQADQYYNQADREALVGNFEDAVTYFKKAIAINPRFAKAYYQLGKLYEGKGWYDRAEEAFRTATNIDPKFSLPEEYKNFERAQSAETEEDIGEYREDIKRDEGNIRTEAEAWAKEIDAEKWTSEDSNVKEFGSDPFNRRLDPKPLAVEANYLGFEEAEPLTYRGDIITSRLDPYHPEHEDFRIPYYKDREGLKLTPIVGVRGEYMQERQMVGIESLLNEAQEWNQRTDEQLRNYISTNRKQYHKEEIILHYNETWPKFTYSHLEERAKRTYDAKRLWSSSNIFYDDYNRDYYQIDYTIPGIRKLGSLRLKFRYGDIEKYKPNDPGSDSDMNSYLFGLETTPYLSLLGTFGAKFEFEYIDGSLAKREETGGSWDESLERNYFVELDFNYPEKFLRIKPHFFYKKERFYSSYNTWWLRKNGVKIEKDFNGRVRFVTDWTYINYARDKDPYLASANHISTAAWRTENEFQYEFVRDWKAILGLDYGKGLGFDGFDYYGLRSELLYKKPGLAEFRLGYGYVDYLELDQHVDTVLFKLGLFI